MSKKLKTVKQYKKEVEFDKKWLWWQKSGVACFECKTELMRYIGITIRNSIFDTPERFSCPKCDFKIEI